MAAVDPVLRNEHALEGLYRNGTRLVALAAYVAAVLTAYLLLAPVLHGERPPPVTLPESEPAVTYSIQEGDTIELIAAQNGLSLAELFAFNPQLELFELEPKATVRVK